MKQMTIILLLNLVANFCYTKDSTNAMTIDRHTLEKLQDDLREVRRDQLNYKIEKDLLKETYGSLKDTYTSNYTTVQIIISLILGLFAILGYIGFKGIISLKKEYDTELNNIKELKANFEAKLKELNESQEKVKGQIASIDTLNEEQSKKIKLLEIKEKVGSWYGQKGYQRALDYIAIGLELSKDDLELLVARAFALLKFRNYPESIEAHKKVLNIDPSNGGIIQNLAELYLIVGQIDNYEELVKSKGEHFKSDNDSLLMYLESFKYFTQGKTKELIEIILRFVDKQDLFVNKNHMGQWDFSELYDGIKGMENSKEKNLFLNFTNYLKGSIPGQQIKKIIEGQ